MIELTQFQLNVLSDAYYELTNKIYDKIIDAESFKELDKVSELERLADILSGFYIYTFPYHVKRI